MIMDYNNLNNTWLCWIPGTSQAYAVEGEKRAGKFVKDVNKDIGSGKININKL